MAIVRIGDLIEIKTAKGLAYAQCTHKRRLYGTLIRVLPGFFPKRPESLREVVMQKERFVIFFPIAGWCKLACVN